jgi:hypothetical protein
VTGPAGASICSSKSVVCVQHINIAITDMCHCECSGLTLMTRNRYVIEGGQMVKRVKFIRPLTCALL